MKLALRFVLAFAAFTVLLQALPTVLGPPDVYTQFIALGIAALVATPMATIFVWQSHSLERLGAYFLAVNVLVIPIGLVVGSIGIVVRTLTGRVAIFESLTGVVIIVTAYALAFHLVYRGGYARLKTRFA